MVKVKRYELERSTTAGTDILDLTDELASQLRASGVRQGMALVFTPGSTAAVTTIEFESGAVEDLRRAVARMAPEELGYQHDRRWGDGNGYAHVRAALLGPSVCVPVVDGHLELGTWQQVVLVDFDNRPRERRVVLQVMGTEVSLD